MFSLAIFMPMQNHNDNNNTYVQIRPISHATQSLSLSRLLFPPVFRRLDCVNIFAFRLALRQCASFFRPLDIGRNPHCAGPQWKIPNGAMCQRTVAPFEE